jgi:penicillin amidase
MMRRFSRRLALIVAVVALAAPAGISAAAPPTPIAGLLDDAEIARDVRDIAHISANNDHDLFFLQGWVHAQDRLLQIDVSRRLASGTLAELLGPSVLASDVQFRTLGLRRAAERSLPVVSAYGRAMLHAYANGVNAWVGSHPLPPEYSALGLDEVTPWTPVDTLAVAKLFAFALSFGSDIQSTLDYLAYVTTGSVAGFDGARLFTEDTHRVASFTDASTVPDAGGQLPYEPSADGVATRRVWRPAPSTLRLARDWTERLERVPVLGRIVDDRADGGSNTWGLSGALTRSGDPMIANDPHLFLDMPSALHPIHLRAGDIDVYGESIPGTPAVIVGHSRWISWGATQNPMDVTDTFQERVVADPTSASGLSTVHRGAFEHVLAIPEQYRANIAGDVVPVPPTDEIPVATLIVPRRSEGPIVAFDPAAGTALSLQWAGFAGTREVDAVLTWAHARNLADFRRGLSFFDVGSQNFSYADTAGNLAIFTAGEMPLRQDLEAGTVHGLPPWFIRDGTGGNEWLPAIHSYPGQALPYEIFSPDEMPQVVNPPAGFFVNANNDPAGTSLDNDPLNQFRSSGGIYYLNAMNVGYDGFRAGRITEMIRKALASGQAFSFADMQEMQADVTLIDAEAFVPFILGAWDRAATSSTPELAALAADPDLAEAVGGLRTWSLSTPTGIVEGYDASDTAGTLEMPSADEVADSVAATIYAAWRSRILANTIDGTLQALGLNPPEDRQALSALRRLLERYPADHGVGASGVDFFRVPGVADSDDRLAVLVLRSLREGLDELASPAFGTAFGGSTDQDDYWWGRLHRVVFDHPLGPPFSAPPAGGAFPQPLPGLPGIPTDGGFETVDAASHDARASSPDGFMFDGGPARRAVDEVGSSFARSRWMSALPGGPSGVVGDPAYVNLLPDWLMNEAYPQFMQRSDLLPTFVSIERFEPS